MNADQGKDGPSEGFLAQMAQKHNLALAKVGSLAQLLGHGIGDPDLRDSLHLELPSLNLTLDDVRALHDNRVLIGDFLDYALLSRDHVVGSYNKKLSKFLDAERQKQVDTAQLFIAEVIQNGEKGTR